jgi:hypothetical protein
MILTRSASEVRTPFPRWRFGLVLIVSFHTASRICPHVRLGHRVPMFGLTYEESKKAYLSLVSAQTAVEQGSKRTLLFAKPPTNYNDSDYKRPYKHILFLHDYFPSRTGA